MVSLNNRVFKIYLLLFVYSLLVLLFCTTSSPLYVFNTWDDSNIFFILGKGMMNGFVPYKDLYEQKGPLLYFLNGVGYLISNKNYFGIYLVQSISLSVVLFFAYRIARIYLNDIWAVIGAAILPVFIFYSTSYSDGGNVAEEYILPFIAVSLYFFIQYFSASSNQRHKPGIMLLHGVMCGCVFLIKYNNISFWAGYGLIIAVRLIAIKEYRNLLLNIAMGIAGFFAALTPYIVYACLTDSLSDWCSSYLLATITYARIACFFTGNFALLKMNLFTIVRLVFHHSFLMISIVCSIVLFIKKESWNTGWSRWGIVCSSVILYLSIYGSGRFYNYYIIPLTLFTIPGIVVLLSFLPDVDIKKKKVAQLLSFILMITVFTNYSLAKFIYSLRITKAKLAQQKFADIINKEKNPTLLEVVAPAKTGGDGFYNAASIMPAMKYFFYPNLPYELFPYPLDSQYDAISNKRVMFLVINSKAERKKDAFDSVLGYSLGGLPIHKKIERAIVSNYSPVLSLEQMNKDGNQIYILYKVKERPDKNTGSNDSAPNLNMTLR